MSEKELEKPVLQDQGTPEKPRFVEGEKQTGPEIITVTVSEVPGKTIKVSGEKGKFTLRDVLEEAEKQGLSTKNKEVEVNQKEAGLDTQLQNGDVIMLVSQVSGGGN